MTACAARLMAPPPPPPRPELLSRPASSPRLRARSNSGRLSITCNKDAPEQNAHQWQSFKWGRKKRQSILYSWACGMTCVGVWLVHAHAAYTIPYCVSPASPRGERPTVRPFARAVREEIDRERPRALREVAT